MQINLESYSFYIKPGAVDMRKGARSLAYIVQEEMGLAPFSKSVFVFCGKNKLGLEKRKNYNIGSGEDRVPNCPPDKEKAIIEAFKHFKMI